MKLVKKLSVLLSSLLVMLSLGSAFAPKYNSHADETNTWNITRKIASKQFSVQDTYDAIGESGKFGFNANKRADSNHSVYLARLNKRVSHKVDNYLIRTRNLHKYNLYFSRVTDVNTKLTDEDDVTATVTFIRK